MHDCGHLCCGERYDPHHDHYLGPIQCPACERIRQQPPGAIATTAESTVETTVDFPTMEIGVGAWPSISIDVTPLLLAMGWGSVAYPQERNAIEDEVIACVKHIRDALDSADDADAS